jgi:hypothetical protein
MSESILYVSRISAYPHGVEMRIPLLYPITSRRSFSAGNSKRRSIQSSRAWLPHWATVHTRSRTWPISRSASLVCESTNELPDAYRAHWTRYKVIAWCPAAWLPGPIDHPDCAALLRHDRL